MSAAPKVRGVQTRTSFPRTLIEIRKTFSDHGYEIEAHEDFQKQIDLTIRKGGKQLQIMKLPPDYGLEAFAARILVGIRLESKGHVRPG